MSANNAQAWRRWFGLLFLALSFGMLVWGQTVLRDQLKDTGYLLYWAICFFFTFLAICTALLDLLLVRRQNRIDQRDLLKKAFTSRNPDEGELDDSSRRDHSR